MLLDPVDCNGHDAKRPVEGANHPRPVLAAAVEMAAEREPPRDATNERLGTSRQRLLVTSYEARRQPRSACGHHVHPAAPGDQLVTSCLHNEPHAYSDAPAPGAGHVDATLEGTIDARRDGRFATGWRYTLAPDGTGTHLTESFDSPILEDRPAEMNPDRHQTLTAMLTATLHAIKEDIESDRWS